MPLAPNSYHAPNNLPRVVAAKDVSPKGFVMLGNIPELMGLGFDDVVEAVRLDNKDCELFCCLAVLALIAEDAMPPAADTAAAINGIAAPTAIV